MKSGTRIEHDSMGPVEIPETALYGPQTQRAVDNFTLSGETLPWDFISAVLHIKKAAAVANMQLGLLDSSLSEAIIAAVDELLEKKDESHFPVSVYQTGSGTSTNMNVNEVISRIAELEGHSVSANDHVNLGQSSNDVIPTAIHLSSARALKATLLPSLLRLIEQIRIFSRQNKDVIKTGRTHLMDALPIRLEQEFEAWAVQLEECADRFSDCMVRLTRLPLGGTAIGSGVNCHPQFSEIALEQLNQQLGLSFARSLSLYKGISSMDTALELSGNLKTLAMALFKIANDLRLMNSGPIAGIGEIRLPALQPGSSIMPAKVNPVIPEAVCMASLQVLGYDTAITVAAGSGNFQLNTMLPLIGRNLLDSLNLLSGSCEVLREKVFEGLQVNFQRCSEPLTKNPILVTALNPEIGYLKAAEIGKIAASEGRSVLEVAKERTDISEKVLRELLDPAQLADGGKKNR